MGGRILASLVFAVCFGATMLSCSERVRESGGTSSASTPDTRPFFERYRTPADLRRLAREIQQAVDDQGSYRLTISQSNLVLPQWGGVDGGFIEVDAEAGLARASLERTGDGPYTIVLSDGETIFRRATCQQWARVPGGGKDVLSPFILAGNDRIADARGLRLSSESGAGILSMQVDGVGAVALTFSSTTLLPFSLHSTTATSNGQELLWQFGEWGLDVSRTFDMAAHDRGPGGNPC